MSTALVPYRDSKPLLTWQNFFGSVASDGMSIVNASFHRFVLLSYGEIGKTVYVVIGRTWGVVDYINNNRVGGIVYEALYNDVVGFQYANQMVSYIAQLKSMFHTTAFAFVNLLTNEFETPYFVLDIHNGTEFYVREGMDVT